MIIAKPYAKLIRINGLMPDQLSGFVALKHIEFCARVSHASEEQQTEDSWRRFIQAVVIEHGDWSVVEHATATVDMLVDRGVSHEVVRHRLFSYTQSSTRFINFVKKMPPSFVDPGLSDESRKAPNGEQVELSCNQLWRHAIHTCEQVYKELVDGGIAPQIARSIFPNALATRILMTGNLRSWRHFLKMRTTKEAHPQLKQVTLPLLQEFKLKIPILFDDLEPEARQIDNMRKPG